MAFEITNEADAARILKDCKEWIKRIDDARDTLDELNLDNWNNYNLITDKAYYDGDANVFVPLCFQLSETLTSRLVSSIFNEPVPVPLIGMGPKDKDAQDRIRALLHHQQKTQVKLKRKFTAYVRSRCIFTKAYAKVSWRTDYRTIKKRVLVDEEPEQDLAPDLGELSELDGLLGDEGLETGVDTLSGLPEETEDIDQEEPDSDTHQGGLPDHPKAKWAVEEERIPVYDCWDLEVKDYFNMGVDPLTADDDLQNARFMYEKVLVTDSELALMAEELDADGEKKYKFLKAGDHEGATTASLEDDKVIDKKRLIGIDVSTLDHMKTPENEGMHEIHICYYTTPFKKGAFPEKHALFTILNQTYLIQAEKNPWFHGMIPYISGSTYPRPKEFEGQSVCSISRTAQYEVNAKRNQALDADTFSMMQMMLAGGDAGIEDNQFTASQNGVIHCDNIEQIRPLVFPNFSQNGYQAEQFLKGDARESTGITEAIQGIDDKGPRKTAFQVGQNLSQGSERLKLILEEIGTNEWPQLFEMAHFNNQQFLTQDTFIRFTESERIGFKFFGNKEDTKGSIEEKITLKDIAMPVDFVGMDFQEKELENIQNNKIVQFFEIVSKFPPSPENRTFFNIVLRLIWTKVLKKPLEDLIDDKGNYLLLTQPGAANVFDTNIQDKAEADLLNQQQQQESEASQVPGGNVGGLGDQGVANLADLGV